jgi:hypothetical protein
MAEGQQKGAIAEESGQAHGLPRNELQERRDWQKSEAVHVCLSFSSLLQQGLPGIQQRHFQLQGHAYTSLLHPNLLSQLYEQWETLKILQRYVNRQVTNLQEVQVSGSVDNRTLPQQRILQRYYQRYLQTMQVQLASSQVYPSHAEIEQLMGELQQKLQQLHESLQPFLLDDLGAEHLGSASASVSLAGEQVERRQSYLHGDLSEDQTRTITDSGYASASNGKNHPAQNTNPTSTRLELTTQDSTGTSDARTVYSDASSIPSVMRECYLSDLAESMIAGLRSRGLAEPDMEKASSILPDLLQAFALKVGHDAPSQMHRDVMVFIHKNRR